VIIYSLLEVLYTISQLLIACVKCVLYFLDPPNITAPGLLCTEGCCELPIMTVYSDSDNVYQVCNTSLNPLGTTIKWCDGGTPAEKGNNKQVCDGYLERNGCNTLFFHSVIRSPIIRVWLVPLCI